MCKFKSGIAIRINECEVVVKTTLLEDSHTNIRLANRIAEDNGRPGFAKFQTPVELVPDKLDFQDKSCWRFVFDDERPGWWKDGMTEQATNVARWFYQ